MNHVTPEGEDTSQENSGTDPAKLERLMVERMSNQSIPFAILGGLMAAIVENPADIPPFLVHHFERRPFAIISRAFCRS